MTRSANVARQYKGANCGLFRRRHFEALAIYADKKNEIAVVLTDMVMPFMDGPATIRALQRMNPTVKIIAASGLGTGQRAGEAALEGVSVFLNKPYTAEKLLNTLAQVLKS